MADDVAFHLMPVVPVVPDFLAVAANGQQSLELLLAGDRLLELRDPLGELVLTVLSQNTADTNSGRAFTALLSRFSSWDAVLAAPVAEVIEAIRPGGLAPQKGPRIQAILARVLEQAGFEAIAAAVITEQGLLDKFIGDALMAEFGVPRSRGDAEEALAAVRAAVHAALAGAPGSLEVLLRLQEEVVVALACGQL